MKSMTGMGRAEGMVLGASVRIEIKSINHRFCEVSARLPSRYSQVEFQMHKRVKEVLNRGKIDIYVFEEKRQDLSELEIKAFQGYYNYLANVQKALGLKSSIELSDLLNGVGSWLSRDVDTAQVWREMAPILEMALTDLDRMRTTEGKSLTEDIAASFGRLHEGYAKVSQLAEQVREDLKKRLKARIFEKVEELSGVDDQRLHTEVMFLLDRMDISEELARLKSHLEQARGFLDLREPVGRKLDFLIQEINREFNTIASKSQSVEVAHIVVEAKSDLEKIREQVQNVE